MKPQTESPKLMIIFIYKCIHALDCFGIHDLQSVHLIGLPFLLTRLQQEMSEINNRLLTKDSAEKTLEDAACGKMKDDL